MLPLVAPIGGTKQTFSVATGIRVQTAIDLASVCPGKSVCALPANARCMCWQEFWFTFVLLALVLQASR